MRLILFIVCFTQILNPAFENTNLSFVFFDEQVSRSSLSISTIRPYQLNFLQLTEISGNISIRKFRFHLSGFTLGDKIYKETVFKLSSEKSINDRLSAGVLLSNYHLKIQNYGSTNCVTLGVLVKTNIATGLEANLQIPSLISISKSSLFQEIPQIFSLSFLKLISK